MKIKDAYIGMEARYIDGRKGTVIMLERAKIERSIVTTENIETSNKIEDIITIECEDGVKIVCDTNSFSKLDGEKYYICPDCGELITQSTIDDNLEYGGSSNCYCRYDAQVWDPKTKTFQPECYRVLRPYKEISKEVYDELVKESNTVIRLRMLSTVSTI